MPRPAPRRVVLTVAAAVAATAAAPRTLAVATPTPVSPQGDGPSHTPPPAEPAPPDGEATKSGAPVDYHAWVSYSAWRSGATRGVQVKGGRRPGIVIGQPAGVIEHTDPHTGRTTTWESSAWTSPPHRLDFGATELVASWNAHTPRGTWIQVDVRGTYSDGTSTPWYVLGRWASGDGDLRRTSVDHQTDGISTVWTDTLSLDHTTGTLRLTAYQARVTLHREPNSQASPTVWRVGAMASALPDRFTVPASVPGPASGIELAVPRYSQQIHKGQYPEYDNGGEAWCSPTSSQMVIEYHGREPTTKDLAWVHPDHADPQVCHAARHTYDWQYAGCGNWPFNTAYAATYRDMEAAVTRLRTLTQVEQLIAARLPVITSQSFLKRELAGAAYGTAGHLMCVVGFTRTGDVIVNDPASPDNPSVRRVYQRRQFETVWLRTKRHNAEDQVTNGTGGIAYLMWPTEISPTQRAALAAVGIR